MRDNLIQRRQYALQGFLLGGLPPAVLTVYADNPLLPGGIFRWAGVLAAGLLLAGCDIIFRHRKCGGILMAAGVLLNLFILYFECLRNPLLTLFCLLPSVAVFYYLLTARLEPAPVTGAVLQLERVIGCSAAGFLLSMIAPLFSGGTGIFAPVCAIGLVILMIQLLKYGRYRPDLSWGCKCRRGLLLLAGCGTLIWLSGSVLAMFLTAPVVLILALRHKHADMKWQELISAHPARSLVVTFLGLSMAGTLLLRTPWAMTGEMGVLEAAFTAVSAVCVTGLTVIDVAAELTVCGQFFLLLLIQLGGLGIMTLATLVLHAVGRLSLSSEQLMTELTQSGDQDVFDSLRLIVRFSFTVELIGALLLTGCFFHDHGDMILALRQGIFTSISAFCNAGFFPGANSLVPYAGEKLLLIVVALEIIAGGIAPAVIWAFLKTRRCRQLPLICKMVLGTTGILIAGGTGLLLLFEWDGIFRELAWHDKVVNGFFQAVTLRTAGFNTVSFAELGVPAYLIMIALMFIGGSPGGTAGGIKTTTLAVLTLTFRAAVRNDDVVTAGGYRIGWRSVVQAVAVLMAATAVLAGIVMMLVTTQSASVEKLIFEAVSALATVGLSLDCTGELDPMGRMTIMAAMLIGRIGPLTLFCFLSERQSAAQPGYPQIKIPLG